MVLPKQKQGKKVKYERNIEDAPFYTFIYNHDELPLDPAKSFLEEQIIKMKLIRALEFKTDLDLHIKLKISNFELDNFYVPPWVKLHKLEFPTITRDELYKNLAEDKNNEVATNLTGDLIKLYRNRRSKLFEDNFHRILCRDYAHDKRSGGLGKRKCPPKIKKIVTCGDESKIRSCDELRTELNRMANVIEKLIEPQIKKKRMGYVEKPTYTPCKNVAKMKLTKKQLKIIENHKLKYQQVLQPNSIEDQIHKIITTYDSEFKIKSKIFTNPIYGYRERSMMLLTQFSVLRFDDYPSKRIENILTNINKNIKYFETGYNFIQNEKKYWPDVYPEVILMDFLFSVHNQVPVNEAILITVLLTDLQEDFRSITKREFLKYILNFDFEKSILRLEPEPPEFPIVTIRAPVAWKCSKQVSKNRLEEILMITHPVIQAISLLWRDLYYDLRIIDTSKFFNETVPFHADKVTEFFKNSCIVMKDILVNDWLPRVADIIDVMRPYWKDLVSFEDPDSGRGIYLFNCIHALMSYQLTSLIKSSIEKFYNILKVYREGNCHLEYVKLKHIPFMTISVSVVGKSFSLVESNVEKPQSKLYIVDSDDPMLGINELFLEKEDNEISENSANFVLKNSGKMFIDPYMEDLEELFVSYLKKILRVGYKIPRIEYFMTQDENQKGYLHTIQEDHVDMIELYKNVKNIVKANLIGPTLYLYPIYNYYFPLLAGKMKSITEHIFSQKNIPELPVVNELIEKFNQLLNGIVMLRNFVPLNLFMLDNRNVNNTLVGLINEIKNFVLNYFITLNQVENRRLCDEFEDISLQAGERPKETPEVVALQNFLQDCRDERLLKLKAEIKVIVSARILFLLKHTLLDQEDITLNSRTFLWPEELDQVLDLSSARLTVVRESLEEALKERRSLFEKYITQEQKKMDSFRVKTIRDVLTIEDLKEKVKIVDDLMDIIEKCSREAASIATEEHLLQLDISSFPVLIDMVDKMDIIEKLWRTAYHFETCYENWYFGNFMGLDARLIQEEVDDMWKTLVKLIKQLVGNPQARRVAEQMRLKIDKFKNYVPVLEAICRQGMSQRHWNQISEELGVTVNPELYPTLNAMIDVGVMKILNKLEEISFAAGKEYELNTQLIDMQKDWEDVRFGLLPYRDSDTHILASLDDVQTLLDDHILKSQAMRGSPYIAALGNFATDWEDKLILMQDILDVWVEVQSTWMYLEPIFSSEDIMKQMPTEGRNFKVVDRIWRKIMKNTLQDNRVIQATDYPNLLKSLQTAFHDLEEIQKGLNMYLEKKRLYFARFFFLSNDELLEILSETKDPLRVQPHLKKCFEGINYLEFDQNTEILGMISADAEVVPFTRRINPNAANGLVEKWLKEVMVVMFDSVRAQIRIAYDSYWMDERKNWVLKWPGQAVLTVSCMTWTEEVEEAIISNKLADYFKKCESQILDLITHVRGSLKGSLSATLEALIVLDVHARDIVDLLNKKNITVTDDFNWHAQLRYYWKIDNFDKQDYICVSMVATDVRYGMEYLGNQPRLVVTPLTDRCYRTLMGAIKVNLGGAPEGPAGTGKTETSKDLAKSVAKKCVVFNCSDSLDYKAIGKFLKGLAQSGAWACFDEFNRMKIEVLSVIAQQVLTIQRAIARKVVKLFFEDTMLQLDSTCTIFITMNPGYAGRSSLPDNLKMLFRTVAMMVPDYAMISEISLYSCGFETARPLAEKIVQTYKLCSEQLSSQYHYDYGMRAIKSVLIASASLKKLYPLLAEPDIVLRAIIDVNLPKFLQEDIQLFIGIYTDLFPSTEIFEPTRTDMTKWILAIINDKKLQPHPWFIEKVMQIYEMILVRHGVMIVGGTMGGKTTAIQLLSEVLRAVAMDKDAITKEYSVNYRIINPKSITIGQLYGSFDPVSHEWTDGVLAKTFREMANWMHERQWIIFDGPVDAIWIENLNTTLDDNKKLCLMSGEIIQMSARMTLLFEPADLEQASPATISRVGMIYMEPAQLGWEIFHKTFMVELQETGIGEIYCSLYETLVEWLIPAFLGLLKDSKSVLNLTPMHSYCMMSNFFRSFNERTQNLNQTWFQQTFLFCLVWAYGSTVTVESRKEIDLLFRKILYGSNDMYPKPRNFSLNRGQIFPEKMTIFDYRFDEVENWWPWYKAEDINLPAEAQISDLIVTTKETGYITYWINNCILSNLPIMIIGPTGTGKSAVTMNCMVELPKKKFLLNTINFSARTSANQVQDIIMSKLDRRRKGVFGPPVGKKCLVFADDIGMPARDEYGSQPPLELLRQWIDHKQWSDLKDTSKLEIVDMILLGAMGLLGGSNYIYPRLYRHMFIVGVDAFEDSTIFRIFSIISEWHFKKDFVETVSRLAKNMCSAVIDVFRGASSSFLPTPEKSHYIFSLRDITRVYQGLVLVPAQRIPNPEKLARLWTHEIYRVFCDRLNDSNDRNDLMKMVKQSCHNNFRITLEQAFGERLEKNEKITELHIRDLMFGNYMEPEAYPKIYDEIENLSKVESLMNYYLNEYNANSNSPMNLVIFRFAIEHISRISRILQMQRGNLLLVGLGGSGRKSAVKLAASMLEIDMFQVEISKSYAALDWKEDIKRLLFSAGLNGKPTVFLFSDAQAKDEYFIEDISSLLNTGEITNLFQSDDKATIIESMQAVAKTATKQIDTTALALYSYFVERVREFLHIALAFSPIGNSFKQRVRMFPSLINCCTINWFTTWPDDALLKVAESFLKSMNINNTKTNINVSVVDPSINIASTSGEEADLIERKLDENEYKLVEIILKIKKSVVLVSEKFYIELGRKNYITPSSYLEMLKLFKSLYDQKYDEITMQRDRYTTGLDKLQNAAGQVQVMQTNLYELQPQLKITSEETEKIMVNIERETAEAEKKKEVVGADEAAANEAAAASQAIKDDCESDLQEAIPALESALSALDTLKPADITVVKSMKNPPAGVKLVLEAVCVIKGFKPDRKPDANGRMIEDYWGPSLKMLGDMKFLESLKTFDKNNIPGPIMKKIRDTYIADRDFVPEKIKNVSTACEGLCSWVRAMEIYDRVAKIVAPKKIALAEAETELQAQMEKLNEKKEELLVILNKLQKLNDYFAEKSKEKKNLEDEIDNCEKKLVRAEKLLGGLGGEKTRWSESAKTLDASLVNVVGDVLIAAGCIAYLGCFTTLYRKTIITEWNMLCIDEEIPCSKQFSLSKTLGSEIEIRSWNICGLPVDNFSIENGIIVSKARRWPLMIDPQVQANRWIKNMEKDNNLKVIKQTDNNYMKVVEQAVKFGYPVLLENIGETIDFGLFPILEKNVFKQKGAFLIKFGDGVIEYNHNFKFYITTCLGNPKYSPETTVMVTLINFMITEYGLREQLLTTVVIQEKPELQEKKEQLIVESAKNRATLYNVETKILQVLSSSEGNILEDENAINILSSSKILSEDIIAKQAVSEITEKEIDTSRQLYIPVANHSSVLFFCLTELPNIDPMYHFSLTWFLNLFVQTIIKCPKSDTLSERLNTLMDYFTLSIYENVCRSLFERDKLIFSFAMCLGILRSRTGISNDCLSFLLSGSTELSNLLKNPAEDWLSDKSWADIVEASKLEGLQDFYKHFTINIAKWKSIYDSENPGDSLFPHPYNEIDQLLYLIILKALRPDKIVPAVKKFIANNLGQIYVEPPTFSLTKSFDDSNPITPLIFLLSPGSDPVANIIAFSKEKGMYDKCKQMSLGQGQGPKAIKMLNDCVKQGHWIILQNVHVAESWMEDFEKFCNDLQLLENVNIHFRLWCTSYPSEIFPISVLQSSVKMTNESPKGLKLCIMKLLNTDPLQNDKFFSHAFTGEGAKYWLRGVFGLLMFHAIVLGRKEFGPLGWNIPYEFNESDLRISLMQLKMFIKQYNNIPFEGHSYLTGECNYGGRVTDDKDRRLLVTLLSDLYNQDAIDIENYKLSESGNYAIPTWPTRANSIEYINSFPDTLSPEIYGLHDNADIVKNISECYALFDGVLLTQNQLKGQSVEATGGVQVDLILTLCQTILNRLPNRFDTIQIAKKNPLTYSNSMNTVLRQETIRFNVLLETIKLSLIETKRAIMGQISMIPELENIYRALRLGRIPTHWANKSYPSLKPLGSYINDLLERLKFFQKWIDNSEPICFWISGFYFTQSFLTAVLQNFSRRNKIQIDLIEIFYEITSFEHEVADSSEVGLYFKGLFLEGARWNRQLQILDEALPRVLFDVIPIIYMTPKFKDVDGVSNTYECPVYKTNERRGILSTTGHSTNFVMMIPLNTEKNAGHWIKRGTASLLQLME